MAKYRGMEDDIVFGDYFKFDNYVVICYIIVSEKHIFTRIKGYTWGYFIKESTQISCAPANFYQRLSFFRAPDIEKSMLMYFIRRDQKQHRNGEACQASPTCFWSSLIKLMSKDTYMVFIYHALLAD